MKMGSPKLGPRKNGLLYSRNEEIRNVKNVHRISLGFL